MKNNFRTFDFSFSDETFASQSIFSSVVEGPAEEQGAADKEGPVDEDGPADKDGPADEDRPADEDEGPVDEEDMVGPLSLADLHFSNVGFGKESVAELAFNPSKFPEFSRGICSSSPNVKY